MYVLACMHVCHADLTTSNRILSDSDIHLPNKQRKVIFDAENFINIKFTTEIIVQIWKLSNFLFFVFFLFSYLYPIYSVKQASVSECTIL